MIITLLFLAFCLSYLTHLHQLPESPLVHKSSWLQILHSEPGDPHLTDKGNKIGMTRREKREGETKGQRGRERESERVIEREREKERGREEEIERDEREKERRGEK